MFKASQPVKSRSALVGYNDMGENASDNQNLWYFFISGTKRFGRLTVVKQFTQRSRSASTSGLLSINSIQRLVYEQTGSETENIIIGLGTIRYIWGGWGKIWHKFWSVRSIVNNDKQQMHITEVSSSNQKTNAKEASPLFGQFEYVDLFYAQLTVIKIMFYLRVIHPVGAGAQIRPIIQKRSEVSHNTKQTGHCDQVGTIV